jgi:alpha-beta hydrolase superfamily lysophospholipase
MPLNVEFLSEGSRIKGHLYQPAEAGGGRKFPAIVVCHGFAGVKELLLPRFAEKFAAAGNVVLTFDYRGFGESEGRGPRIVPGEQAADIRNAITFLSANHDVDAARIGLWGTSYGGANVIAVAACDPRVKALAVQITFADGVQSVLGQMNADERAKFLESLDKIWARAVTTGKELMLPLSKMLSDSQSKAFYEKYHAAFPSMEVKLPFLTVKETLSQRAIVWMPYVTAPTHFTIAGNDMVNLPEGMRELYAATRSQKELLEISGAGHYDIYEDPHFEPVSDAQASWFKKWL